MSRPRQGSLAVSAIENAAQAHLARRAPALLPRTIVADGITAVVDGDVRTSGGAIPPWILCEIGDDLSPWPACR